jgi:hypothetical protein
VRPRLQEPVFNILLKPCLSPFGVLVRVKAHGNSQRSTAARRLHVQLICRAKKKKTEYLLNWVPPQTTQEEYYTHFQGVIGHFVSHCNCDAAILAYGATGSGKTFSSQGPDLSRHSTAQQNEHGSHLPPSSGIIQRAIQQILQVMKFLIYHTPACVHLCM